MRLRRTGRVTLAVLALAALAFSAAAAVLPAALAAQAPDRLIEGRVSLPGDTDAGIPVRNTWVVLHRVGTDAAGPLDSMRTGADGSYRFRYRATGDSLAVYFVSTSRGGVSYFTPPVRDVTVRGGVAEILVFDTTSTPLPITVRARHVIVTVPDSTGTTRSVIEAYEVSNDSSVTRVARGRGGMTFDAPLPAGVRTVTPGQGDVSAEAVVAVDGRVRINAPLAPGLKQITFAYEIPVSTDALDVLVEVPVSVLEVLVEDPAATVAGAGLVAVDPVEIEGRPFRRFLAQDVAGAQTFRVTTPVPNSMRGLRLMLIVTAVGAAMLLGLGMTFMKKGPAGFARKREDDPEALALAVAALDAAYERIAAPTEQQKADHYLERMRIKGRLSAALAKRDELG
jgi:hypothetical protein